jgi:hypothetical protein
MYIGVHRWGERGRERERERERATLFCFEGQASSPFFI